MVRMLNGLIAVMRQAKPALVMVQVLNSDLKLVDQFTSITGGGIRRTLIEKGFAESVSREVPNPVLDVRYIWAGMRLPEGAHCPVFNVEAGA